MRDELPRRHVGEHHPRRRQRVERLDAMVADDLTAVVGEDRDQRVGDRLRAPGGERPADEVAEGPERRPRTPSSAAGRAGGSSGRRARRSRAAALSPREPAGRPPVAPRSPVRPNRAIATGWRGTESGESSPSTSGMPARSNGAISRCQAGPSGPSPAAVSSTERCRIAAPDGSGWASGTSGWTHRTPCSSSGRARSAGRCRCRAGGSPSTRRDGSRARSARRCGTHRPASVPPRTRRPGGRPGRA